MRRKAVSYNYPRGVPGKQKNSALEIRKAQLERLICGASFNEGSHMGWAPPPCGTLLASCLHRADLHVERGVSREAPRPCEQFVLYVRAGQPKSSGATGHSHMSNLRQQWAREIWSKPERPHYTAQQNAAFFITRGVVGIMLMLAKRHFSPPAHAASLHAQPH